VKRIGPTTEPCGKPQDDDNMEEEVEPEVTENDLSERKDLRNEPMMPKPEVRRLRRIWYQWYQRQQ